MKKTIRLTESKLRRLIESTINEMNWKIYANASRKRGEQANYAAANSLSNAAAGAFNDQYGDEDFEMDGVTSNGLEGRYDSMSHWGMDNDRGVMVMIGMMFHLIALMVIIPDVLMLQDMFQESLAMKRVGVGKTNLAVEQ